MTMHLEPFNSPLWQQCRGAYGDVSDIVASLMRPEWAMQPQTKIRRLDFAEKNDYQIAFDNLWENLTHQMSFYEATYLVLPYMVTLLAQKQGDFIWQQRLIAEMGVCLSTDFVLQEQQKEFFKRLPATVQQSYCDCIQQLQSITKEFLRTYASQIKELPDMERNMLLTALPAIFGEARITFVLIMNSWDPEECYLACAECEFCDDETCDLNSPSLLAQLTPPLPQVWDGQSFDDVYTWYSSLLREFGTEEERQLIDCYFSSYTCPECGAQKLLLDFMANYFNL